MFQIISTFLLINFALTSAFSVGKAPLSSSLKIIRSLSSTSLFAIWDLNLQRLGKGSRNLQGDDTEVPVIPTIGEEVTSKGAKKATLKGPGVDERTVTIGCGPFSEDDLDSLPRLYKFHKQLSLLDSLQGKQWGGLEKLQRLKQAELEGFLPKTYASNNIRSNSVTDDKLLNDWNFDMNA